MSKKQLSASDRNKLVELFKKLLESNAEAPISVTATAIIISAGNRSATYRRKSTPIRKEKGNL